MAIDGDGCIVIEPQTGRWSSLLPVGMVVRRPSTKLVQLVAQAIHESPHRVLRVTHVYAALQSKYPYYKLLDKGGINSWKSSVHHALFQKWFVKVCPTSMCENVRHRNYFWGLNYYLRSKQVIEVMMTSRGKIRPRRPPSSSKRSVKYRRRKTKKPSGRKRRQTAARGSSDCTPSVPQLSIEEQAGPSSTYLLPHMNLWKMKYMKMDAWPAASQAFVNPSESATTSAVPTMASPAPAFVQAAVESFQSSMKPEFPPLDQNEKQQMTWPESLQKSQESQQSRGKFMASEAENGLWEMTTSVDIGFPAQPFDDKYNFNLAGEHSNGATTNGASGKFSPRSVLFSPTHLPQITSLPSYTDLPLSDAKPPLLSPEPQKAFVSPSESATTSAVPTMASPAPAFVPAAVDSFQSSLKPEFPPLDQNEQQQMTWPESLQKSQESQQSWGEFMASQAGNGLWEMTTSVDIGCPLRGTGGGGALVKAGESPTRRDNGEDTNDFDDGLLLPLEELDSCSAHAPTEPDPSAPTDQGAVYASAHWNGVPRV
ncbi:hypothetical protein MRX96_030839 [Rhipicephalus microplus]